MTMPLPVPTEVQKSSHLLYPNTWALEQIVRQQSEQIAAMEATIKSLLESREDMLKWLSLLDQRLSAMRDWPE